MRVLVALVSVLALGACAGTDGDDGAARDESPLPPGRWIRVEPGGATSCARGGEYAFWARRGDRTGW